MKILLPDSLPLDVDLPPEVTAISYEAGSPVPPEHRDAEALVAWGNSGADLSEVASDMPNLQWVQTLSAGPDSVLAAGFPASVTITTGAGLHDRTVTEHALALTLALVRRLSTASAAQVEHRWAPELGGLQPLHPEGPVTSLLGARVLIWGFGNIGQTLAPVLRSLGATVRGAARSAGTRAGFDVVADDDIRAALQETDILIMILPATDATCGALDADRLAALSENAYVVNVGRGTTVDEDALIEALTNDRIAGAALDVTAVEPLPSDSPLWDAPRLLLTPHAAGGRPVGADQLIADNLRALRAGEPLRNAVAR